MKRNAVVLCIVSALLSIAAAQTFPVRLYGDTLDERAEALVEANDGGFVMAGWTRSFGPGAPLASNILVVKTDPLGVPQWSRVSVGSNDEEAYSMTNTRDGGYCLTGFTRSFGIGAPQKNVFVLKLDAQGNNVWGRVFGGLQDDEAFSIVETHDGGFAVTGRTWSFGPQPTPNILVLRLDATGRFMWQRVYWMFPNHVEDEGWSIVQTPDRGFALTGRAKTTVPHVFNPFVMKLDSVGNIQWTMTSPGGVSDDEGRSVAVDLQGNILAAGFTRSFGASPTIAADDYVAAFNLGGFLQWSRTFGWPQGDEQALGDRALVATSDGGSALCGLTTSVGPGTPNANFMLTKLAPGGLLMWCRSHPSPYDPGLGWDVPMGMVERTGGGYALLGWTNSWPNRIGGEDWILSTFDFMGNRPVCAEAQWPTDDSMPWIEWIAKDSVYWPEHDTIFLVPAEVRFDSACYDTTHTGIREGRSAVPRRSRLSVAGGGVSLTLDRAVEVRVEAYSPNGRRIAVLVQGELGAGRHEFKLPGAVARGPYVVRAVGNGWSESAKVVRY